MAPKKHVPQRTCLVCRSVLPKRVLIRVVRTPEGAIVLDPKGKVGGRGAYLCPRASCYGGARARNAVSHALETSVDEATWEGIKAGLEALAQERAAELQTLLASAGASLHRAEEVDEAS